MRKEAMHFDFAENNVKASHDVRRHSYSIGADWILISLIVNIFLPNLAYKLGIYWIILTKNIVCVRRLYTEL